MSVPITEAPTFSRSWWLLAAQMDSHPFVHLLDRQRSRVRDFKMPRTLRASTDFQVLPDNTLTPRAVKVVR